MSSHGDALSGDPLAVDSALADRFRMCVRSCVAASAADSNTFSRLERCARDARRAHAKPEHIILTIRLAWHQMPEAPNVKGVFGHLLTQMIELALDAYFDCPRWVARHAVPRMVG